MAIIQGTASNDSLIGTAADDLIDGWGGNDSLHGAEGFDRLSGGSGDDTYIVSDQWDVYFEWTGHDKALVYADFVKPAQGIEQWELVNGAKALPYWIDALVAEDAIFAQKWLNAEHVFYYAFPSQVPTYFSRSDTNGWQPFTSTQKQLVDKAFDYIESIIGLRFVETSDINRPNVIAFSNNTQFGSAAYATYPSDDASGSDVFVNATSSNLNAGEWSYAALALIHEIGHALGLKHPFSEAQDKTQVAEPPYLSAEEDDTYWTVMSYNQQSYSYMLRYASLDVASLQYLYGPSTQGIQYDNTYFINPAGANFIWDGAGVDSINASSISEPLFLSMQYGDWSWVGKKSDYITDAGQITINIGTLIEEAVTGSGSDKVLGNDQPNRIRLNNGHDFGDGLGGSDTIEGGDGDDTLIGGLGDDVLDGGRNLDTARFSYAAESYALRLLETSSIISYIGPTIQIYPPPPTEGTDTLINIERLQFADKTIRIDTKSHGSYADLPDTLYQFFVVGFGAAPGVTYMDQMAEAYRYWLPQYKDGTVKQIVEAFTTKSQFTSVYPQALYRTEGGKYYAYAHDASLAGNPLVRGAEVTKSVFDTQMASLAQGLVATIVKTSASEATKAAAAADIQAALGLGGDWTIGKVIYTVFGNLASKPLSDPTWGGTAKQFANQVAVAKYYTDTLSQSTDDVTTLRSVMAAVTNTTDVSSTDAIASLIGVALLNGPGG